MLGKILYTLANILLICCCIFGIVGISWFFIEMIIKIKEDFHNHRCKHHE